MLDALNKPKAAVLCQQPSKKYANKADDFELCDHTKHKRKILVRCNQNPKFVHRSILPFLMTLPYRVIAD